MKIKLHEIVDLKLYMDLPVQTKINLNVLHRCLLAVREASDIPMVIRTPQRLMAGFRTEEMQRLIYKGKDAPMGSLHLLGAAADVLDFDGVLKKWILDHLEFCEHLGLYFESFDVSPTWAHIQIFPTASGNRFFKP